MAEMSDYDLLIWLVVITAVLFVIGEIQNIITMHRTMKVYELTRKEDEADPSH